LAGVIDEHDEVVDRVLKRGERDLLMSVDARFDADFEVARALGQQRRVAAEAEPVGRGRRAKCGTRRHDQQVSGVTE
jgi:hypothetical protein